MSLSLILNNEKVEHYIRIKTHKLIILRFWVESDINVLCSWVQVSLALYLLSDTPLYIYIYIYIYKYIIGGVTHKVISLKHVDVI